MLILSLAGILPAPAEAGADGRGVAHVAAHGHVEVAIVVGDLHDRPLARRGHVVGLLLREVVDRPSRREPDFFVYPSVDAGEIRR